MDKETLQYIAQSDIWDKVKEFILIPKIEEVANVLNDIQVNSQLLSSAEAYNAKAYTARALQELIRTVDSFKVKPSSDKEDFE